MGNCLKKNSESLIPLLKNKDSEIMALKSYIESLQLQIDYLMSNKSDIHDQYYNQVGYNQQLINENIKLKDIINS